MLEKRVNVPTKAGSVDTFICHPERHGPWPGIIFYMDAPGIREELYDMARRIASVGYYVLLPNLYYRHGHGTTLGPAATDESSPEHQRMWGLIRSLSNGLVAEDTEDLLAFIDGEPQVRKGPLGCVGYCMSGPFAVTAAARFADRFAAAASLHGVALVTDRPDSPHLLVDRIRGEVYFGFGEIDRLTPRDVIDTLRGALEKTRTRFEIEIYPGADHGFVFPRRATYHKAAAERHWERLFQLFRRSLG